MGKEESRFKNYASQIVKADKWTKFSSDNHTLVTHCRWHSLLAVTRETCTSILPHSYTSACRKKFLYFFLFFEFLRWHHSFLRFLYCLVICINTVYSLNVFLRLYGCCFAGSLLLLLLLYGVCALCWLGTPSCAISRLVPQDRLRIPATLKMTNRYGTWMKGLLLLL